MVCNISFRDIISDFFSLRVRFLSYAGTPFLLSLPCFYLSIVSAIRVFRTHNHLRRSWYPNTSIDDLTPVPTRRRRLGIKKFLPHAITTPFGSIDNPNASHTSVALEMGRPVSPGFPTFTPTSRTPAASDTCEVTRVEINPVDKVQGQDDRRPSTAATESSYISDVKEDPGERKSTFDSEASVGGDGDVTDDRKYGGFESKQAPNIPHSKSLELPSPFNEMRWLSNIFRLVPQSCRRNLDVHRLRTSRLPSGELFYFNCKFTQNYPDYRHKHALLIHPL